MADSLIGVRAKIDRAKEHMRVLDEDIRRVVNDYFNSNVRPARIDVNFKPGSIRVYWVGDPPPVPVEWPVIFGEFLFDLRSALDHLAEQLVIVSGGKAGDRDTGFPIFNTEIQFQKYAPVQISQMRSEIRADIERLQPFHTAPKQRAGHVLRVLGELNNIDKHRTLNLTEFWVQRLAHKITVNGAKIRMKSVPIKWPVRIEDNAELVHLRFDAAAHAGAEMNMKFAIVPEVSLSEVDMPSDITINGKARGLPVLFYMNSALKYIENTILPSFEGYLV